MPLAPLVGHDAVRSLLAGAVSAGRLPQAMLFTGPRGVGKQRLALWLAQRALCERPNGNQEPCGACKPCRQVLTLQHPDLHWFVPLEVSKKGADAGKQIDLVAEALAEEMAARREQPLYDPFAATGGGLASHAIASVRLLLRRVALTPAAGSRKIFIVGDAERLIPQHGTEDAANALLKVLEEPPADTTLILTASDPNALLATILSRVVLVRVARLPDSVVAAFVQQELGISTKAELTQRVSTAEGCIGKLFASGGAHSGSLAQADRFLAAPLAFALGQVPFQARGSFTEMLDALAGRLREAASTGGDTEKVVAAIARVMDARQLAQGNVNPQLLAAVLAGDVGTAQRS